MRSIPSEFQILKQVYSVNPHTQTHLRNNSNSIPEWRISLVQGHPITFTNSCTCQRQKKSEL